MSQESVIPGDVFMLTDSAIDEWIVVVGSESLRSSLCLALGELDASLKIDYTDDPGTLDSLIENRTIDLLVFDQAMSSDPGGFLESFNQKKPDIPVLLISRSEEVRQAVEVMRKGAFHVLPTPINPHELERVLALGLEVARNRRELRERKRIMRRDLEMAQHIQMGLLPPRELAIPGGAAISTRHIPAEVLGGDFYDVAAIDNKHIGMLIADVSGHGVAASLVVVVLKTLLLNAAAFVKTPAKFMESINTQLLKIIPESYYLTCFYGILNTKTGNLSYTSCGHPSPFLLRKDGGCERLECRGFFLGLDPRLDLEQKSKVLNPGDQIILFTDGITDNRINEHEQYGDERLQQSILKHAGLPASQLLDNLIQDFHHRTGDRTPDDDVALMCVEYRPEKASKAKKSVAEEPVTEQESSALSDLIK